MRYHALGIVITMKSLPRYVANPLLAFRDYMDQSDRLLHMSIRGICTFMAMPNVVRVLKEADDTVPPPEEARLKEEEYQRDLELANARADFARKEQDKGFPLLHAHALVGAWGAMEAAIKDSVIVVLLNESELLRSETFSKVRVSWAEFELLDKEERIRRLVEELGRGQDSGAKKGLDGLEVSLNLIGLAGSVDEEVKRTLWAVVS